MAQRYSTVTWYVVVARSQLQDMVAPYRYADQDIVYALNHAIMEISRIRDDLFLDLKYQRPLRKGDTDDGLPPAYTTSDISVASGVYNANAGTLVPIPSKYSSPVNWFISGWLQFYDVADTQDQRAQAFIQKFQQQVLTVSAA